MALAFLDQTASAVALPNIQVDLHASAAEQQWVVGAYLTTMAAFIPAAGRIGDLYGRRRMFLGGVALFGLASLGCAVAPDIVTLIVLRAVQGVGAALILPLSQANVTAVMDDKRRGWAIGILAAGGSVFLSLGPLVGGAIVTAVGWRWLFAMNVPIVACSMFFGVRHLVETREPDRGRLDLPGLILLALGVGASVTALLQSSVWGATAPRTSLLLGGGVVLLLAFVVVEHRSAHPLVHLRLLRVRTVAGCLVALVAMQFAVMTVTVQLMLYLQRVMGFDALVAGVVFLPVVVATPLLSPSAGRIADRPGGLRLVPIGLVVSTAALAVMALVLKSESLALLVPAFAVFGLCRPFVFTLSNLGPIAALSEAVRGLAASLAWEAIQIGAAFGVAVSGLLVSTGAASGHFTQGVQWSVAVAGVLCLVGAVGARILLSPAPGSEVAGDDRRKHAAHEGHQLGGDDHAQHPQGGGPVAPATWGPDGDL